MDEEMFQTAFPYAALLKVAEMEGLEVTDEDVAKYLITLPVFKENGKFSQERYSQFVKNAVTGYGYTEKQLDQALRDMLLITKLNDMITAGTVVTENELEDFMMESMAQIQARKVVFDLEKVDSQLNVTEDDLLKFFAANSDRFVTEPVSGGLMAYIPYGDVSGTAVTDEQVNAMLQLEPDIDKMSDSEKQEKASQIRALLEKTNAVENASEKIADFYHNVRALAKQPEFMEDPAEGFRHEAAAAGLSVMTLEGLTTATPASQFVETDMIRALTSLKNLYSITNVIKG